MHRMYNFKAPSTYRGLHLLKYIYIYIIIYKCCCKHLLAISNVLEALEHLFQSYGAFCPCNFTYLDTKLEETHTEKANGKGKFCGAIKWLPLIPGSSSATEGTQISCRVISWPLRSGHEYIALVRTLHFQSPCNQFFK